ncbi:hypothetical protein Spa2297_34045 (plasmid) [Streptomyces parvulus]|uniref:Uncharacterized protein n=1 Tax=Streptomyces parvulus TaxID=146923 RepID=A0A191VAP0_9ACTN|nr:hypothetical protein Spa2297_34045 [Streptomyces parvulus]
MSSLLSDAVGSVQAFGFGTQSGGLLQPHPLVVGTRRPGRDRRDAALQLVGARSEFGRCLHGRCLRFLAVRVFGYQVALSPLRSPQVWLVLIMCSASSRGMAPSVLAVAG